LQKSAILHRTFRQYKPKVLPKGNTPRRPNARGEIGIKDGVKINLFAVPIAKDNAKNLVSAVVFCGYVVCRVSAFDCSFAVRFERFAC